MPVSWLDHNGKSVLYVDYRGLRDQEAIEVLREQREQIEASTGLVLSLVDVRGAMLGSEFMRVAKVLALQNTALTARRAIVGVEGVKELLLTLFNAWVGPVPMKPFPDMDEALAYLTGRQG